jgi:putative hydrolase of the HAD superfamily
MKRSIRALIFDAGNTLLRINYPAIADQLALHGIRVSHEAVAQAEYRARVRLDPHLAPGSSTESRSVAGSYFRYVLEGLGITDPETIRAVAEWRKEYNLPVGLWHVPDPEAETALRLARDAGCVAGVISNSNGSVRSILEETGLAAHLQFILDSAVVGVEKPDPRIFRMGLAEARVEPWEAVYIGDLYSVDVLGARSAGMAAVLLDPGGVWGKLDCPTARSLEAAVRLALG